MINNILEKIGGKWIFLIIVFILYCILGMVNFALCKEAFMYLLKLLYSIIPIFILVFILMFISSIIFDSKKVVKLFGEEAGIRAWIISIIGGILSTGPIYMWYPMLSDLRDKGIKDSFIVTFLYNRAVKIPLLAMMIYYFQLPFVIVLTFYMILFSIINGVLVDKILNK